MEGNFFVIFIIIIGLSIKLSMFVPSRLENIKHEGLILESTLKRKVNKSHKTFDLSDLEYIPQRKGSGDSLNSQRSFDSQHSSDSHSSPTIRESSQQNNAIKKHEQWSSTSIKSETDSENGVFSAPPVIGERFSTYSEEDIWFKQISSNEQTSKNKSLPSIKRDAVRTTSDGLRSLPPIRRQTRETNEFAACHQKAHASDSDQFKNYFSFDRTPNKAVEILGKPEVPLRNFRKQKRGHVKSLGDEVTDSVTVDKSLLGTIDESLVTYTDSSSRQNWQLPKESDTNTKSTHSENDWSTNFKQSLTPKRQRSTFTTLDLRRRNSDPATKVSLVSEHPSSIETSPQPGIDLEWQKHGMFSIAGHKFRKINRFNKDDTCTMCNKEMDAFITQGYKCIDCKKTFHTKCIQNKSVLQKPCVQNSVSSDSGKPGRRKYRKHSRAPYDFNKPQSTSKFSLTGTSEFTDRTDKIISDARELQTMQDFITSKICKIEHEAGENTSEVDRMFKQALREFKDNLVQFYSAANKNGFEAYSIKYKDLITNFMQAMETVCQRERKDKDFPVTMGVNAFRGFMDEFMSSRAEAEKPNKTKRKKDKKRKTEDPIKFAGHTFVLTIINIPTACEVCSSFFMWPIERGLVCQSCKFTCHKKCYQVKTIGNCGKSNSAIVQEGSNKLFGVPLTALISEEGSIPVVIERLLATIEITGLYTEGIYRKSGVSSKVKELKAKMEENQEKVNFESYQVHVLASVLKSFLREMPEPLLTFECYENFITAANMTDPQDRVSTLYDILKKLPKPNYDLMERLIFHLARIALHERTNRMSAASLAIVFAPCILRTNKVVPAQDSLHDIGSQTRCIETIITEQMLKIRITLDDIDTLDTARQAATNRLSSLRSSKVFSPDELLPPNQAVQPHVEDEENLLVDHIQEIQKEKEHLTSTLPILTHATSDDDMLSTDGDGSLDDISCVGEQKKIRGPIVRTVSGGDSRQSFPSKLKRQSSSDISVTVVDECEDTPIMV